MIAALRGVLERWDDAASTLWLDVGGVSYEVVVPAFAGEWVEAHTQGAELRLFTYYYVSERNPTPLLIGFPRLVERDFFRKFIEVPDIGPAKAVRALTQPVSEIARAIEGGDTKALQQLPGIGARLAQTIVARLQGKLLQEALLRDEQGHALPVAAEPSLRDDAVEALVALQYTRREAETVVNETLERHPDLDQLETLLRAILERRGAAS